MNMFVSNLHPVIRLAAFLVFALLLTRATAAQLVFSLLLLSGFSLLLPWSCTQLAAQRLWRLRWLFFSIMMVFALMTPGQGFVGVTSTWWPTYEGLVGGLRQCSVLVLVVLAVNMLLFSTTREALLQGIRWWLAPLESLGMPRDRIALRLMLVLVVVPTVQEMVREQLATQSLRRLNFSIAASMAASLFGRVEACAEEGQDASLQVPVLSHPPLWQWCWPLLLMVLLLVGRGFSLAI